MIENILTILIKSKVRFLVVGGVAVNLHGFYRATGDIDIILLLEDSNLKKFIKAVKALNLVPRIPVRLEDFADAKTRNAWIKEKNMKAFTLYDVGFGNKYLDVVIDYNLDFNEVYKSRSVYRDGALKVPVLSLEDLVKMKRKAGRERDKIDIKALKRIQKLKNEKKKS